MKSRTRPAVLIGYSTASPVRQAFEELGCDAWTADVRPGEGENHLCMDALQAVRSREWDLVILHPMCTYLTVSGAWAYTDGPYHQKVKPDTLVGAARREARAEALENFRALLSIPYPVAIENPATSFVCTSIRRPDQVLHPYMFGEDVSKATGLWLSGVPPVQVPPKTEWVQPRIVNGRPRWGNQTGSGQCAATPGPDRWLQRSGQVRSIILGAAPGWARWLHSGVAA